MTALCAATGARIQIDQKSMAQDQPCKVEISGNQYAVQMAVSLVKNIAIRESVVPGAEGGANSVTIECDKKHVGMLIGRGGQVPRPR